MYSKIVVTKHHFPREWCDWVNTYAMENLPPDQHLGKKGVRKCTVRLIMPRTEFYDFIFKKMNPYIQEHSPKLNVDLDGNVDGSIQHITYDVGDHVGWHDDTMDVTGARQNPAYKSLKINRKLSMTIILSDPQDYEGGRFVFDPCVTIPFEVNGKGTTALFTSHSRHAVEPITKGRRNILFAFLTGPDWR